MALHLDGRFRKDPRLTPPRGVPAARNPPSSLRAPQTCEELRVYIENVRMLQRVRDVEWVTLQPLVDLAESGVWKWHLDVHYPLLSNLFRLSGTLFSPEGLLVYPHVLETGTILLDAPATARETRYLHRQGRRAQRVGSHRTEGQGSCNHGAPTPNVAAPKADDISETDARRCNRHL